MIAEASISEEPGAVVPHAGICAGAVGQLAVLPRYAVLGRFLDMGANQRWIDS